MSATHSEHFDRDLTAAHPAARNRAIGEIVRLAREAGLEIRHRPQGWTTVVDGETRHWWPAQVNLFVDYLADEIRNTLEVAR